MFRLLLLAALVGALVLLLRPQWRPAGLRVARTLLLVGAALLYLRSPIDLIPDGIGPAGFLDDILVLALSLWWARQGGGAPEWMQRRDRARAEQPHASQDEPPPSTEPWNPHRVLGLEPDASQEDITRAYRAQMKRYHPDRVEGLGAELREVANRKTREIQQAYEELRRRP